MEKSDIRGRNLKRRRAVLALDGIDEPEEDVRLYNTNVSKSVAAGTNKLTVKSI